MTANPLPTICFDGYYNITMNVRFCSGAYCYVPKCSMRCLGATKCDPDPNRITSIPDPKVEITYIEPDTCDFNRALLFLVVCPYGMVLMAITFPVDGNGLSECIQVVVIFLPIMFSMIP
ncbi:MAG: hypothetical protein IPL31_04540 [Saprospiraceae bacterium]|nr:hypothetical protein [Saprospiraceae bacterium]